MSFNSKTNIKVRHYYNCKHFLAKIYISGYNCKCSVHVANMELKRQLNNAVKTQCITELLLLLLLQVNSFYYKFLKGYTYLSRHKKENGFVRLWASSPSYIFVSVARETDAIRMLLSIFWGAPISPKCVKSRFP